MEIHGTNDDSWSHLWNFKRITKISDSIVDCYNPLSRDKLDYHKTSNISRTQSQSWYFPRPILQLSLPNPLKADVKSGMKM